MNGGDTAGMPGPPGLDEIERFRAPRTSPTTIRSGRRRNVERTSSAMETTPGLVRSGTWSSAMTLQFAQCPRASMHPVVGRARFLASNAFASVVLPVEVPPAIKILSRARAPPGAGTPLAFPSRCCSCDIALKFDRRRWRAYVSRTSEPVQSGGNTPFKALAALSGSSADTIGVSGHAPPLGRARGHQPNHCAQPSSRDAGLIPVGATDPTLTVSTHNDAVGIQ